MGFFDKLRDIIDPNTEADRKRRLAQGQSAQYIRGEQRQTPQQIQIRQQQAQQIQNNPNISQARKTATLGLLNAPKVNFDVRKALGDSARETGTLAGLGAVRSVTGLGQGVSGLYDLATPGKGTNRLSQGLDRFAKFTDETAKTQPGNQLAYKAGQAGTDALTFGVAGKAVKGVSTLPKVAKTVAPITNSVAKATTSLDKFGKAGGAGSRILATAGKATINPAGQANALGFTALTTGADASKGRDISAKGLALNLLQNEGMNVGLPVAGRVLKEAPGAFKSGIKAGAQGTKSIVNGTQKVAQKLEQVNPGIRELDIQYNGLNKAWQNASATARKQIEQAIKANRAERSRISQGGYIKVRPDGSKYVKVTKDQQLFDNAPAEQHATIARKYIADNFRGKSIKIDNNNNIYFTKKTGGKYTTRPDAMTDDTFGVKMRLAPELDNAVKASQPYKTDVANTKAHKLAKSWDYRTVEFEVGGKKFVGKVNIANAKNGKTLYDINGIKELPTNGTDVRLGAGSYNPNIPNNNSFVNKIKGLITPLDQVGAVGKDVRPEAGKVNLPQGFKQSPVDKRTVFAKSKDGKSQVSIRTQQDGTYKVAWVNKFDTELGGNSIGNSKIFNSLEEATAEANSRLGKTNTATSPKPTNSNTDFGTPTAKDVENSLNPLAVKERGGVARVEPSVRGSEYWNVKFNDGSEAMNIKLQKPTPPAQVGKTAPIQKSLLEEAKKYKNAEEYITATHEKLSNVNEPEWSYPELYNMTDAQLADIYRQANSTQVGKTPRVVISEAVNKGSGTKVQKGIKVVDGKPQQFQETVPSQKLVERATEELPNMSDKPVELNSIAGRENTPVKKRFIDLTNEYLGSQKAGTFNAVDRAKKFNERFGNLTDKQKNEVIFATDDPKFGTKDPLVQKAVDYLHNEFDSAYQMFTKDRGLKLGYQESYYPRQYVNKKTGAEISSAEYNLLQRSSARQKGRTADALAEWKLVTRDPAEALVKYYSSLEKAAAGKKYLKGLQDNGLVISSSEPVRGMQPVVAEGMQDGGMVYYAKPDVAKQLNKLFGTEQASGFFEKSLEKAQGFNSFMQSFVLSGGVPNTPINAFGIMQLMKNGMALHPIQGGKAFYMGMTRKGADKFFENHQPYLQKMAQNGLDVRYDYRPQMKKAGQDISNALEDKGAAKAVAVAWDELTNDATFGRFMPALETMHFKGVYDKLVKSMPEDQAAKVASEATANFFGKNTLAKDAIRSKVGRDASGALLFAPRFRESMLNFWVKNAQALKPGNIGKVEYRDNLKFMGAAALTYGVMDGINYSLNGTHMYQNPDGKKDKLLIPNGDQYIGVPFLPSIATVPRNAFMGAYNLATGNLNEAGKNAKSFLSIPARAVGDLVTNENYFGAPIVQKDATPAERAAQVGSYLVKGNMQPWIREGMNAAGQNLPDGAKKLLGVKKQTGVQTASQALELPFRFYNAENMKGGSDKFGVNNPGMIAAKGANAKSDRTKELAVAKASALKGFGYTGKTEQQVRDLADGGDENAQAAIDNLKTLNKVYRKPVTMPKGLNGAEATSIDWYNRLTDIGKSNAKLTNPAKYRAYQEADLKNKLLTGSLTQEAYDKKLAALDAKKTTTKKTSTRKGKKPTLTIVKPLASSNYGLVSKAGKGIKAKTVVKKRSFK